MTEDALRLISAQPDPVHPVLAPYLRASENSPEGKARRRYQKWKMAGRPPLAIDTEDTCTALVDADIDDGEPAYEPCGKTSCYLVERSDGDESFGALGGADEACTEHVGETIHGMMGGDESLRAIVTPRWWNGEGGPDALLG